MFGPGEVVTFGPGGRECEGLVAGSGEGVEPSESVPAWDVPDGLVEQVGAALFGFVALGR